MSDDNKIILLDEILEHKKRKEKELEYYLKQKEILENKLSWINRELQLTNAILKMIEKESIIEIKK
jgi:hypothetical protein